MFDYVLILRIALYWRLPEDGDLSLELAGGFNFMYKLRFLLYSYVGAYTWLVEDVFSTFCRRFVKNNPYNSNHCFNTIEDNLPATRWGCWLLLLGSLSWGCWEGWGNSACHLPRWMHLHLQSGSSCAPGWGRSENAGFQEGAPPDQVALGVHSALNLKMPAFLAHVLLRVPVFVSSLLNSDSWVSLQALWKPLVIA